MPNDLLPGLLSVTFRKLAVEEVIALANECDLVAIEWAGDVHVPSGDVAAAKRVARLTIEAGLVVSAYGSYYRAGSGANASFESILDSANALGTDMVRIWAGCKASTDTTIAERDAIAVEIRRVCAMAADRGVDVALEFHENTLTDDADSCVALLRNVEAPNLRTFWQPPNGMPTGQAGVGLQKVLPWLANLHVFHWWPTSNDRLPLEGGVTRWNHFVEIIREHATPARRYASLEFVVGDSDTQFRADARTLRAMLARQ